MPPAITGKFYLDCNSTLAGGNVTNSTISSSVILTSSIDMNNTQITNVGNPINPQDAATKAYVDALMTSGSFSLTGTVGTVVSTALKGAFTLHVTSLVTNGPNAIFTVAKTDAIKFAQKNRLVSSPGDTSLTQLKIDWAPSTGIMIRKTNSSYDGNYSVKII